MYVTKAQLSTNEVLEAHLLMTRWKYRIVPCLAGGHVSVTCLKILVMRFADVQSPAPLSLHSMFKAQYKCQVIIIAQSFGDNDNRPVSHRLTILVLQMHIVRVRLFSIFVLSSFESRRNFKTSSGCFHVSSTQQHPACFCY